MAKSKGILLGMLAETPLHPGAGQAADVIDLPVSREGATGLPQIPETGLKGALKQWTREYNDNASQADQLGIARLFGGAEADGSHENDHTPEDGGDDSDDTPNAADAYVGAGELMISTARLLCLPVRRLDGPYAWVTCPYLLERLKRDSQRCGCELDPPALKPTDGQLPEILTRSGGNVPVFLEEYSFQPKKLDGDAEKSDSEFGKLKSALGSLVGAGDPVKNRLLDQIAVMSNAEFAWFAQYALPVDARNALDVSKMSKNLWYEETLPPDSLLYAVILPRAVAKKDADAAKARRDSFLTALQDSYLQIGGNETVGQGWVRLAIHGDLS